MRPFRAHLTSVRGDTRRYAAASFAVSHSECFTLAIVYGVLTSFMVNVSNNRVSPLTQNCLKPTDKFSNAVQ
jgi:hypothetical protein